MRLPLRGAYRVLALAACLGVPAAGLRAAEPLDLAELRQNLFATCFTGDQEVWMVGELGRIFHSVDGGRTWERQHADTRRPFLAISCTGPGRAWIAGKEGIVYQTTDAGATWKPLDTGSDRHVFALAFADEQRGHGAGDFGAMVHTEDGGQTWTRQQVPEDIVLPEEAIDMGVAPGDVNLYGLSYGDRDHLWAVGEFGIIMTSSDGGLTWTQQHSPFESTLFGVHFVDAQRGWAVGIDSVIITTVDGGATWTVQPPPVRGRSFYDVAIRGQRGWIVGDSGTLLVSSDGGATWRLSEVPIELAANWLRSVALRPNGRGLAVGADGLVFRLDGEQYERLAAPEAAS
ncbi:MAG TPA: YCF48-related protein [Candidatus Limnocylindria bacterium]|nr:YCF48-related protein [Candidatus Limnocylindria bacterium]